MTFAQVLREARERSGLSMGTVARACVIDPSYLHNLESGYRRTANPSILRALANTLHLSLSYLYYLNGRIPPNMQALSDSPDAIDVGWVSFEEAVRAYERDKRPGGVR